MASAREHFSQMLTAAEQGNLVVVSRRGQDSALVQVGRLRWLLAQSLRPHEPQVVRENGNWVAYLPGLPLAVEEPDFDTAIAALIEAMREYAADWQDHLHAALNHRDNVDFVQFVELSTDEQLKEWLTAAEQ
ncbi:prevent-host-death protein [Nocardia sp. NPDC004068]|uniref:prevent-host-death protein n=1 Tax=Nocardia sp. NPDC004068 TaxID=3364303 RepID=UPI0036783D18